MITTELRAEHGRTIVLKRADPTVPADLARLGREATMLAVARHPGVVELAAPPPEPDVEIPAEREQVGAHEAEVRTIFAGARTLAAADLAPLAALRALAAAAETLADLHGLGLVHGRVTADHVVLAESGRAVLCGFAEAGLAGERRGDGELLVPSVDVAAMGSLLARHLDRWAAGPPGGRRPPIDLGAASRLAARATAPDPTLRPSARSFAVALDLALPRSGSASPLARRPDPVDPSTPSPPATPAPPPSARGPTATSSALPRGPRRRRRRILAVLGATSALASLGLGVNALARAPGPTQHHPSPSVGSGDDVTDRMAAGAGQTLPEVAAGGTPQTSSSGTSVDLAPDATATVQAGGDDVVISGRRFALGTPDDQVVHAPWGCGSTDTPVLVRPDGSVFRFSAMAEPGREVTGISAGRLPPQATVELVHDDHGCLALQALGPDGPVVLPIEPS